MVKAGRSRATDEAPSPTESVRDRILSTARELFYREGARSVGVDTVVAQSGVAKTSLYRWFPSKDALIAAVIEAEAKDRWAGWDHTAQRSPHDAREQLRAQIAGIAKFVSSPKYRGCPFMNVTVEFADDQHPARLVAREVMQELRRRLRALDRSDRRARAGDGDRPDRHAGRRRILRRAVFGKEGPQHLLVSAADALIDAQKK